MSVLFQCLVPIMLLIYIHGASDIAMWICVEPCKFAGSGSTAMLDTDQDPALVKYFFRFAKVLTYRV